METLRFCIFGGDPGRMIPEGCNMREEEKKPNPWEAGDPKLPVVQSGHFEDKRAY